MGGFLADVVGRKTMLVVVSTLLPASALLVYASAGHWASLLAAFVGGYSATGSLAGGGVGGAAQPIQSAVLADITAQRNGRPGSPVFRFSPGSRGPPALSLCTWPRRLALAHWAGCPARRFAVPGGRRTRPSRVSGWPVDGR